MTTDETKLCSKCGVRKPLLDFYRRTERSDGARSSRCKECVKAASADRQHRNPEKAAEQQRRADLRRQFDLTPEQYDALLEAQRGVCWICEKPPKSRRLAVDHDHRTGLVRGLLCTGCNMMLGEEHDNARKFARAAGYIDHPPATLVLGFHRVPGAPPVRQNDRPEKGTD